MTLYTISELRDMARTHGCELVTILSDVRAIRPTGTATGQ